MSREASVYYMTLRMYPRPFRGHELSFSSHLSRLAAKFFYLLMKIAQFDLFLSY